MATNPPIGQKARQYSPSSAPASAEDILSKAQSSRTVLQEFCPLAESLEWELGQDYLRQRGNKAFISDSSPVPFVVNNDGSLSRHAADVFFANVEAADQAGMLESEIFALELGIGVGLFARYFLDRVRELSDRGKKDYYHRLAYIAADRSERMLLDVARHGVLGNHLGHYRLRKVDAMKPGEYLLRDAIFEQVGGKPLRAVFLNYLLDCLPAAVFELQGEQVKQLHVRTCLARNVRLEDHSDLTADALAQRLKNGDASAKRDLLEIYGLCASEYDYRPVAVKTLPHGEFALQFGKARTDRLLHSYGAIQCLERLLDLVRDDGFILMNDYGQTQVSKEDEFEHQRFSLATFVGVNFPLLAAFFGDGQRGKWVEPVGEPRGIHARLLGHNLDHATRLAFSEVFSQGTHDQEQEPIQKARACARSGRFELAASFYQEALKRQPGNWVLLNEVAMFLIFSLRDLKAGIDMAKVALARNPTLSADLWNTLGDGLFEFGRVAEARSAYQKALHVNDNDVRARYNLGWVYQAEKNYPAALEVIAAGMGLDKTGDYRERFLQKQAEVLRQQAMRHQQEYLLLVNLVSKFAKPDNAPVLGRDTQTAERPTSVS